jgi:hypothetical protein
MSKLVGDIVTLRITLTHQGPPAVLALARGLTGEEVGELSRTVAEVGRSERSSK